MDKFVPHDKMGCHVLSIWRETVTSSLFFQSFCFPTLCRRSFSSLCLVFKKTSHGERLSTRYGSCPTPHDFEIYAPDASFEDPLMCAHWVKQIKSAFYSLAKVFSESRIVEYSVKEHFMAPGKQEILIDNKQYYRFLGRNIDVISLIKLFVEDGKVVRHEDWWDKKPFSNRETAKHPLAGRLKEVVRRGSMLPTHAMMRFGKDPTT